MIDGLKPYPKYKDSGVPWLGEVPEHWEVPRLKHLFCEIDERSETGDEELLSVSHLTGVSPRREKNVTMFLAESNVGHKLCSPGDVVVNTMWAWMAALGLARQHGMVSPSYAVYRPRHHGRLNSTFVDRLLRIEALRAEYVRRSTGVNSSRMRLYPEQFLTIRIPLPSVDEQEAIGRFIAHLDLRIARYIRAKKKLIALLNEQRKAIVRQAVTHGLNSNVRSEHSGLKGVGHVSDHWEVTRVKHEFECLNTKRVPLSSSDRSSMSKRYDYYGASGIIDKVENYIFDDELLLIAEDGANLVLRNLPLAIVARGQFWVNNHAHILKPRRGNLEFFANLMESLDYRPSITGAAQPKLTQERLFAIPIAVPPRAEQDSIAAYVKRVAENLVSAMQRTRRLIESVHALRIRLVTDVVTGKLDVREAAAHSPPDEAADEFSEMGDTASLDDETDAEMENVEVDD
jgi:type I restriction enzyme, S subunit